MHKTFYASGFLYHSPTQKILLQQTSDNKDVPVSLFSCLCSHSNNPAEVFQKLITEVLGITIPLTAIKHVYDYVPEDGDKNHHVFYADVAEIANEETFTSKMNAEWYTTRQISKLKLPKQADHNITIGQRVIRANFPQTQ